MIDTVLHKWAGNTIPPTKRPQVRNVCFTLNNPEDPEGFAKQLRAYTSSRYFVFGEEIGASNTPHLQGYIEFDRPIDWGVAHGLLLKSHMEPRRGTAAQASAYCKKDGTFTEWGNMSSQGERTDIEEVTSFIRDFSPSMREVALQYPIQFVKFHKGLMAYQHSMTVPRCAAPEVRVYWGLSGTGKSFRARRWLPDAYIWHPQQGTWFDGYTGQDDVIFEEFRGQLSFGMVLSLLDRYDCKVQYKGGVTEFAAKRIAITSPREPSEWFHLDNSDRIDQLLRRITKVYECHAIGPMDAFLEDS